MPVLMRNRTCQEKRGTRVTEFASMDLVCIGNRLGVSGAHWMQLLPQFVAFKVPYGCGTEGRRQFAQCCVLLFANGYVTGNFCGDFHRFPSAGEAAKGMPSH